MKPYQVWCKQCDEWRCLFSTHSPPEAHEYARDRISYSRGTNVQRVEIRDLTGVLETVFDSSWN